MQRRGRLERLSVGPSQNDAIDAMMRGEYSTQDEWSDAAHMAAQEVELTVLRHEGVAMRAQVKV